MINEYCAKSFCREDISLIENYELAINDTTQTWEIHHRRGTIYSRKDLKEIGEYYNRPAIELIFLTKALHTSMHFKGVPRGPFSEAHKKAISDSKKGVPRPDLKGVPLSEVTKKAISDALKGVPKNEATKKAMSEAHKGVQLSEAHKKAIGEGHSKKILQFTKSGEFVREWPSAKEANRELGVSRCTICCCCSGKRKSAGGYVWEYA